MRQRPSVIETDLSRRTVLLATGATGLSAFAGCSTDGTPSETEPDPTEPTEATTVAAHSSPDLEKWVDEVPRPGVVEPDGTKDGQPYYEIEMREVEQRLHSDLPPTTVWGYDGQFPGPTIEAEQGEPIYVRWQNELPDDHFLPVDTTVHGEMIPYDTPGVRTVTHLHGGNIESASDGKARGWFTRDFEETGPTFEKKDYYYVNDQPPATLWYHDHAVGITRLNVYAGLAGFYLLRNDRERELELPDGEYEIPLVLQDRSLNEDGSLFYPSAVSEDRGGDDSRPEPSIVPEFYGDVPVVNGKAWPRLSVEPRKYRLRLLNGSNSRYYDLAVREYDEASGEVGDDGPQFLQIGNDGGLLSEPVPVEGRLEIGSGQRADVVVDFSEYAGETLLLHNDAPSLYRGTLEKSEETKPLPELALVDVADSEADDTRGVGELPDDLTEVPEIPVEAADRHRHLTLAGDTDEYGRMVHLLGSEDQPSGHNLDDPVTEEPELGDTEIWSIANHTSISHPIHLHLVHFQLLGRQPLADYEPSEDGLDPKALEEPRPYELGWNDVISVDPAEVVHVIVHFGEYEGLFNDQTGEYMWHCHMIEHEDYDMMRPFRVLPNAEDDSGSE